MHAAVGLAGDEERSFVVRHSKTPRTKRSSCQRIKAHQSWLVSETNKNSGSAQAVDELIVVLQRVVASSLLVGTETDRSIPCWSRCRQVELGEPTGRHVEIDEQSIADDDQRGGVNISCS